MTSPDPLSTGVGPYGVRPLDVTALVQDARVTDEPVDDQYPDDSSHATTATVVSWIEQVSAAAEGGLWQAVRITDDDRTSLITRAAAGAVTCGAASYLEAATHPRRTDGVDDGGYASVLWNRYQQGIDALAARIAGWVAAGGPDVTPEPGRGPLVSAPCTVFPDDIRW